MKLKIWIMFLCCTIHYLQASGNSAAHGFPFSSEVLQAHQQQQVRIVKSMPRKIEVGTIETVHTQIDQEFIYGQVYHQIGLREFFKIYPDVINNCKPFVPGTCRLNLEAAAKIKSELQKNPSNRDIANYTFIGAELSSFEDDLFNVTEAKKLVLNRAKEYIDNNYEAVHQACYSIENIQSNSKKVFRVPCCKKQFHESCLVACQFHKVNSCPNPECQIAENGAHYSKCWDANFYDKIFRNPSLSGKQVARQTCSLCEESLQLDVSDSSVSTIRDKPFFQGHTSNKKRK